MPTERRNLSSLADASIRHNVYLDRYATGAVKQILPTLREEERRVREKLSVIKPDSRFTRSQYSTTLSELTALRKEAEQRIKGRVDELAEEFVKSERVTQANILNKHVPGVEFTKINVESALEVLQLPIELGDVGGAPYGEWLKQQFNTQAFRFDGILRKVSGQVLTGEGVATISRNVSKTFRLSRTAATHLTRTIILSSQANIARRTFEANKDVTRGIEYNATLDRRTCPICAPDDGRKFYYNPGPGQADIANLPRISRHASCRCVYLPIVVGFADTGKITYKQWFGQQKQSTQREILGPARHNLYASGRADLGDFASRDSVLTLQELERRI
jgi:hypothetical protein